MRSDQVSLPRRAGVWHVLARLGVLLIAVMLVSVTWSQRWQMAFGLAVFLLASLGILKLGRHVPDLLVLLLVLAAVFNAAGGAFSWFDNTAWFDEWAHFYTGFAGLAAIGFVYARDRRLGRGQLVAWCTAMGLALGIGWELVEGLLGDLEPIDTVSDVVLDTVGAALGGLFAWQTLRRVSESPSRSSPSLAQRADASCTGGDGE